MYSPHPSLPYGDFRQACRAFRPSELVPALARMSAALGEPPYPTRTTTRWPPWGLAAAARESLLYGNEHRSKAPDERAMSHLMHKFHISGDIKDSEIGTKGFLLSTMTQFTYEQFPWLESMFEEVARSHAWLIEGLSDVDTNVVDETSLASVVGGMPLRDAIGATFFLQVGAFGNNGTYNAAWLDQPNFVEVLKLYPKANIEAIAKRLITTPEDYRAAWHKNAASPKRSSRFDYNPLVATPFVDTGDGVPVAPAARLILRTVAPGGLYYAGIAAHGQAFANDLGLLFEHYIGRQLSLIDGAKVIPEISYGKGGGSKSVDWFVVMPGLVVLVEVKSKRLGPAARVGGPALFDAMTDSLQRARKQLTRTVEKLSEGHPGFKDIPNDRPILGLIVTAEPFYTGAAYLLDHDLAVLPGGALADVPVATASARDVEMLVTHGADVEGILLELIAKRGDGVVGLQTVHNKEGQRNSILAAAWESYPWPGGGSAGTTPGSD